MDKKKRWQTLLIWSTLLLTIYNILPTIFFYTKPLGAEIEGKEASKTAKQIIERVNGTELEAKKWLESFCRSLSLKPTKVSFDPQTPHLVSLTFKDLSDAGQFRKHLPRAGGMIPFPPNQLSLYDTGEVETKTVVVQRKIPLHFSGESTEKFFQFSKKLDEAGLPSQLYKSLVFDRALQLAKAVAGPSENGQLLANALSLSPSKERQDRVLSLAQNLIRFVDTFGETGDLSRRYFASFTQIEAENRPQLIQHLIEALEQSRDQIKLERISLQSEEQSLKVKGSFLVTEKQQRLHQLGSQEKTLSRAEHLVKKHKHALAQGTDPLDYAEISSLLEGSFSEIAQGSTRRQELSFGSHNPFLSHLVIDWAEETISLHLMEEVELTKGGKPSSSSLESKKEQTRQFVYNEIARCARQSGETIYPIGALFQLKLKSLEGSSSLLALHLSEVGKARTQALIEDISSHWHPKHPDLRREVFPLWDFATYSSLPAYEQKLGLLVYAPVTNEEPSADGLKNSSIYVIAKGIEPIFEKTQQAPDSKEAKQFYRDFSALKDLLQKSGLFGYAGRTLQLNAALSNDFVFEGEEFYLPLLKATREEFQVHGTKRLATLELSNIHQRILTENKIEDRIHEDLLKWRDDYNAASVGLGSTIEVPKPTRSALLSNIGLSYKKYFRGDNRKVLHWGLDLSGGKTVQIELRDQNNRPVIGELEIKQGINELYNRVNKMGVSEVSIRREGNLIALDFPGSQELSANELIKASSMYFHIVNEKFTPTNPHLGQAVNHFLQDVWNEAVITGKKAPEEINEIAWKHIHGDSLDPEVVQPRSQSAQTLYENGLRLGNPKSQTKSNLFDDTHSMITVLRGKDFTEWHGQTHPLLIAFSNFALEGASLKNVQAGYDPNKGNFLTFEIKGKELLSSSDKSSPRDDLYSWTSQFSKDKIGGTPYATYSNGKGWRMAVILNETVITAPTLTSPLKDSGSIEGGFSQREVNQLEADLKAGSLTYSPRILSEKNVSPELGAHERNFGILATLIALVLVVGSMIGYYRFGGLVASVAVVINLFIMWATLQNLGATLTLASIAAGILTLGMAVDANVLVFERIREEFSVSGKLSSAIAIGYKKAFSAIVDSNLTTIIAAVILLQFDSGPVKGFAITIIIGIVSSMFTALFMTKYFFSGWVKNPKHTTLSMANFIKGAKFPFLKYRKVAFTLSTLIILAGGYFFGVSRGSILGMDFTGGYALNFELSPKEGIDYRSAVEKALIAKGLSEQEFQVRQLSPANQIRLFLSKSMQNEGKPFFGMPLETEKMTGLYSYESNPRASWVVAALEEASLPITYDGLLTLDKNWSEISGQLSDSMRNSALIGLGVALLCILVYITVRFEFSYAVSATLCLAHDILITMAAFALLHAFGLPLQIDLNIIAALMTIVGYSLNDTIIVFDRIREDRRLFPKLGFDEIIDRALNVTLSRTTLTSGTTLLALLPLVFLGGSTLFGFSLVMTVGVVFGTLSSLFIAAPLLRVFNTRQVRRLERSTPEVLD